MRPQHYLSIGAHNQTYAEQAGAQKSTWREQVFEDLTESGKCLVYEVLPPGPKGTVLGLCGDHFYAHACIDEFRADTLFIFRIESAARRKPKAIPKRFNAHFELLSDKRNGMPNASPVPLQELAGPGSVTPQSDQDTEFVGASDELIKVLVGFSGLVFDRFRPGAATDEIELDSLRRLFWAIPTFDRDAFSARHEAILRGNINPSTDSKLRSELCSAFDLKLANRIASRPGSEASIKVFLKELPNCPESELTALAIWAGCLAGCEPDAIKIELHQSARAISTLSSLSPVTDFLRVQLHRTALAHNDQAIAALVEAAESKPEATWSILAKWAEDFVVQSQESEPAAGIVAHELTVKSLLSTAEANDDGSANERIEDGESITETPIETTTEASTHIDEFVGPSDSLADPALRWWLRLSLPSEKSLTGLADGIRYLIQVISGGSTSTESEVSDNLLSVMRATDVLRASPAMAQDSTITVSEVRAAASGLSQAWNVGEEAVLADSTSPLALKLLGEHPSLVRIAPFVPSWLAQCDESAEITGTDLSPGMRACLENFEFAQRLIPYAAMLGHADAAIKSIYQIDPPLSDEDPFAHFDRCARQIVDSFSEITSLSELPRKSVHQLIARGLDARLALAACQRFETLIPRVPVVVANSMGDTLSLAEDEMGLDRFLDAAERAIESVENVLGSATDLRLDHWSAAIERSRASAMPVSQITIGHSYVDGEGRRVPAYYFDNADPTQPYGLVQLPLTIECRNPISVDVRLSVRVASRHCEAWPAAWSRPSPEMVQVRSQDWRKVEDSYQYSFALKVPIRPPDGIKDRVLRIEIGARDLTRQCDAVTNTLDWEQIVKVRDRLQFEWSDNVRGDYVERHPIGAQRRARSLLDALRSGNSFAVIAPRRFGKSSLCEYLAGAAGVQQLFVAQVVCTRHPSLRNGNLQDVWGEIGEQLVKEFGVGVTALPIQDIPPPEAFDLARKAARARGYSGIVLMFDEAQLLFARRGAMLGDAFKDLLERKWTRTDSLASVQIALVGLPSLQERCGANLAAMLRIQQDQIKEAELNAVLLAFSQGQLHTTRAARVALANLAGRNLFILKVIVDALRERLDEDSRRWFNERDVETVYGQIRELVKRGEHPQIGFYLRDALNDADSVNDWIPKPCFPLAAALAWAHDRQGLAGLSASEEAFRRVGLWCEQIGKGRDLRYVYSELRLQEDLKHLSELAVYDEDKGFYSPLMQAYLVSQAERFPATDTERNALVRCTIERLRTPKALRKMAEGGQAKVYQFEEGGQSFAWRAVPLRTTADSQRFAEAAQALIAVRDQIRQEDGGQFVYDLKRMGISEDNYGVEVYRWIEGTALEASMMEAFRVNRIVELGWQLCRGVAMLHRNNVLHRDICPRNIIIGPGAIPILVDFGMARPAFSDLETRIASTWSAPEVQRVHPEWTEKADIFSLGATLRWVMDRAADDDVPEWKELDELLCRATEPNPSVRPTAQEMVFALDELRHKLKNEDKLLQVWSGIIDCVGPMETHRIFKPLLDQSRPDLQAACFGLYGGKLERCRTLASFFHKLVEAYTGGSESLGTLARAGRPSFNSTPLDIRAVKLAAELRKARSHYQFDPNWLTELIQSLGVRDEEESANLICGLGRQLGVAIGIPGLKDLSTYVLCGSRETH
jgi:hypothetical protein